MMHTLAELAEVDTAYVTGAAVKLRGQRCTVSEVRGFVTTSRFRSDGPQYGATVAVPQADPSSDTRVLAATALLARCANDRTGFGYKKTAIMVMELADDLVHQYARRDTTDTKNTLQVTGALDALTGASVAARCVWPAKASGHRGPRRPTTPPVLHHRLVRRADRAGFVAMQQPCQVCPMHTDQNR